MNNSSRSEDGTNNNGMAWNGMGMGREYLLNNGGS